MWESKRKRAWKNDMCVLRRDMKGELRDGPVYRGLYQGENTVSSATRLRANRAAHMTAGRQWVRRRQ